MRLWSLHPKYLDSKGLVALWREALLARAVLRGETKGYRHHPQLARFQAHENSRGAMEAYLAAVLEESKRRGYAFDAGKVGRAEPVAEIGVNRGQVTHEVEHLMGKLKRRDPERWGELHGNKRWMLHPLMRSRAGGLEPWERA